MVRYRKEGIYIFLCAALNFVIKADCYNHSENGIAPADQIKDVERLNSIDIIEEDSRKAHARDLMVVLPVMQGNDDLSNSNLQMLYTKSPVTAIIGNNPKNRKYSTKVTEPTSITTSIHEQTTTEAISQRRQDDERHPYTDFLVTKTDPKPKTPLDYGYPESFKFVEELNELPKNHKPEWAMGDTPVEESKETTESTPTKKDPFQMFESVKPLEINKLLLLKPTFVPAAEGNDGTKKLAAENGKRPKPRPSKKPPKQKITTEKALESDLYNFILYTTPSTTAAAVTTASTDSDQSLYTAARYTPLFAESTKNFLPTPYKDTPNISEVPAPVYKGIRATESTMIGTQTTTTITSIISTTTTTEPPTTKQHTTQETKVTELSSSANPVSTVAVSETPSVVTAPSASTVLSSTSIPDGKIKNQIKPSDIISLNKILNNIEATDYLKPTKISFAPDMFTDEMKNMLISLGILKADNESFTIPTTAATTTTTKYIEQVFFRKATAAPTIDPNSYVNFKKIPIGFEQAEKKSEVSDDMKDLLASFGLLPKQSILTRISRQRRLENSTDGVPNFEDFENVESIKPLPYNYDAHKDGHVFRPAVQLDELGKEEKVTRINDIIKRIRNLSNETDLDTEDFAQRLENITSILKDENLNTTELQDMLSFMEQETKIDSIEAMFVKQKVDQDKKKVSSTESAATNSEITVSPKKELNEMMDPPNPLSTEELQQLVEINKNEIKRQQPAESINTTALSTTLSGSSSESGSTEDSRTPDSSPSVSDLADSFGGGETASEAPSAADLPTPRPNGLYFYVDWNSFLNVGEADKNPVNIRFSPRAGNPRNFLPITVP